MNNKILGIGAIIFILLLAAMITRNGDIAWMILPFLAYLGVGILQAPPLDKVHLSVERGLEQKLTNDTATVETRLNIKNLSTEMVCLSIHETIQAGMKILEGNVDKVVALQPGEPTELRYTFTATRGNYAWKIIKTVVSDPLGLIGNELLLPASGMIQIRPQIKKFKSLHFRPNSTLHAPGSIPARFGGSGTDFFGVREYHSGDSLRWLDWRLTARHPRKFFTKEFEQEEIADIGLILDAREGSNVKIGGESLFESSVGATTSLAEMFLHQGHRVSLLVFGGKILSCFPGYGKQQLQRIMSCLSGAQSGSGDKPSVHPDFLPIWIFPNHSFLITISAITSDERSFFQRLRASGYQALLISPDPVSFAYPVPAQDKADRLAIRATRLERRIRLTTISQLHIPVIDWQVNKPLYPLVRNALTLARGQREK